VLSENGSRTYAPGCAFWSPASIWHTVQLSLFRTPCHILCIMEWVYDGTSCESGNISCGVTPRFCWGFRRTSVFFFQLFQAAQKAIFTGLFTFMEMDETSKI
jgi:hypothetical protein